MEERKYREWTEKEYEDTKADTKEPTIKEWIEKEHQEIISDPRYSFIIGEIANFAFPHWFQRIKKKPDCDGS